jgi:beta-N-acetylhexosaminidase
MSDLTPAQAAGQRLMIAFEGRAVPATLAAWLRDHHLGGVTLYRTLNVDGPAQVRALAAALQEAAAAAGQPPLLIAADQEGGQLAAIAGLTQFPGNMALGAAGDPALAERVGAALGRELAACGVNVDYAPVCDVNSNPANPVVGTRSFGEDATAVAALSAALVRGLQAAGVAATAKHFPGHGDTATDSHDAVPVIPHNRERLDEVELRPFRAVIAAGTRLIMSAHLAVPALTGDATLPTTMSPAVMEGLLRDQLGFTGVSISDALDMGAVNQGSLDALAVQAAAAGSDLLMLGPVQTDPQPWVDGMLEAAHDGRLSADAMQTSARRVLALKAWVAAQAQPPLTTVGGPEHQALAAEVAARAVTLVRDTAGQLPLRPAAGARVLVLVPQPANLTPADTSSFEVVALGEALRRYHPLVDQITIPMDPAPAAVDDLCAQARTYDLVIVGTINAADHHGQAALVNALLAVQVPTVAVALRLPYDLAAYPAAPTYVCTYSILPPALAALADVLWGETPPTGRLPVAIPGLYPVGHRTGTGQS